MSVQQPTNVHPQFGQGQPIAHGPIMAQGRQMHSTYAPAHAHYNPQTFQANTADNRVNAQFADNKQFLNIDNRVVNIQTMDVPALNHMLDKLLTEQLDAKQCQDLLLQIFLAQRTDSVQSHVQALQSSQQEVNRVRDQSAQVQAQAHADLMSQQQRTHAAEQEALRARAAAEAQAALAQAQQNTATVEQQATVLISQANAQATAAQQALLDEQQKRARDGR